MSGPTEVETPCLFYEDNVHCEHWYDDDAPCCGCGDDGTKVHGDHFPALDCVTCWDRIREGHVSLEETYELAERRYRRTGWSWPSGGMVHYRQDGNDLNIKNVEWDPE